MGIRQEAKELSRQKIIDAMRSLLQERKADSITIEDITTQAGIAKGSFYTHFKRKEDVTSVIAMEQYHDMMEKVLNLSGGLYEQLREYLRCSVRIIDDFTLDAAQHWMKSVTAPIAGEHGGADKYRYDYDNMLCLIQGGITRGELQKDTPAHVVTEIIMNAYYGAVANWCITSGEKDLVGSMDDFCNYGLQAILTQFSAGGNVQ